MRVFKLRNVKENCSVLVQTLTKLKNSQEDNNSENSFLYDYEQLVNYGVVNDNFLSFFLHYNHEYWFYNKSIDLVQCICEHFRIFLSSNQSYRYLELVL